MRAMVPLAAVLMVLAARARSGEDPFRLPEWFEGNRVQAHSEHGIGLALRLTPEAHARAIRGLGARVLTRIFLSRDEGAWWPSQVGEVHPLIGDRDFAAEIARAVHGQGLKVIAYHRHMSDAAMQREHPDWVCRHPDGSPMLEPRGKTRHIFVLCLNSPYRQYIKTRLLELADRGVDCIYFDNRHMPDVCSCPYCRKAFRKEMGHDLDLAAPVGSPAYMEGVAFVNRSMVRAFTAWRDAVRAKHRHVFFCIKSSQYPMYFSPHMDTRLLALSDTSGTEFHKPFGHSPRVMQREADFAPPAYDDQLALGWSIVRDASGGRPPHMWIPHLRAERQALYSAAAAVTYGCVAAMNIHLRDLERDVPRARGIFAATFQMGHKVSPHLAYARPIPWAALHISERSRNARLPDRKRLWREVFSPALGACQALKEQHLPWVTASDAALERGLDPRTRLLVLPWPDELTDPQRNTVAALEKAGGRVVRLDPRAGWHTKTHKQRLISQVQAALRDAGTPPIRIAGPKAMHAVCYEREKRLTVCLANTWAWFRSTRTPNPRLNNGVEPPPCTGVSIVLSKPYARPKRAFDAVSGKALAAEPCPDGFRVRVADFQINACVVIEFQPHAAPRARRLP